MGALIPRPGEGLPDGAALSGVPPAHAHNLYPLPYHAAVASITPLIWARAGWAGSQRYPTGWAGDAAATVDGCAPPCAACLIAALRDAYAPTWAGPGPATADGLPVPRPPAPASPRTATPPPPTTRSCSGPIRLDELQTAGSHHPRARPPANRRARIVQLTSAGRERHAAAQRPTSAPWRSSYSPTSTL